MKKRIPALLLCVIMLFSLTAPAVYAEDSIAQVEEEPAVVETEEVEETAEEPAEEAAGEPVAEETLSEEPSEENSEEVAEETIDGGTEAVPIEETISAGGEAVAYINEVSGDGMTLATAVNDAAEGDTIYLTGNVTLTATTTAALTINKNLTITDDGEEVRTITLAIGYSDPVGAIDITSGVVNIQGTSEGKLIIEGAFKDDNNNDANCTVPAICVSGGTLNTQNVTIKNTNASGVSIASGATFNMNTGTSISKCTASGNGGGVYVKSGATFNMNAGTTIQDCTASAGGGVYCVGTFNMASNALISKCSASGLYGGGGVYVYSSSGTASFTMNGGAIEECTATSNKGTAIYSGKNSKTTVNNGSIKGLWYKTSTVKEILVYGGAFSFNPADYLASGAVATESDGIWTVINTVEVTHSDETSNKYTTLQGALDAVVAGDTITLLVNIEISEKVGAEAKEISYTLDLNGKSITYSGTNGFIVVRAYNVVTIADTSSNNSGSVNVGSASTTFFATNKNSTLYVTGGSYTGSNVTAFTYGTTNIAISVSGGTFSYSPAGYLAEKTTIQENTDDTYTVVESTEAQIVAKIGDDEYTKLEGDDGAFAKVEADQTIVMQDDYTLTAVTTLSAGILDLNGHTITVTLLKGITVGGTVKITDGTDNADGKIVSTGTKLTASSAAGIVQVVNGGKLTLEKGTISGAYNGGNGAGVYVYPGSADNATATFTMTGGKIENCKGANGSAIYGATGSEITISGGSIVAASESTVSVIHTYKGTVSISGGNITGVISKGGTGASVSITGGTFSVDPYDYLKDCAAEHIESDSADYWQIVEKSNVVAVTINGEKSYKSTFAEAVADVEKLTSDQRVIISLIQDVTVTASANGKFEKYTYGTVTIKMNNRSISGDSKYRILNAQSGTIINVVGSGTIKNGAAASGAGIYVNGGTVNLTNVTISDCIGTSTKATIGNGGVYVTNGGSITMDGGSIENCQAKKDGASVASGGAVYITGSDSKFELKNGTISNCTADNDGGAVMISSGTFKMTGGTITGCTKGTDGYGDGVRNEGGTFEMTGGTIVCDKPVSSKPSATTTITGGFFSSALQSSYSPSDYVNLEVVNDDNSSAPWTVSNTYYTLTYDKNFGEDGTGDTTNMLQSDNLYYLDGYTSVNTTLTATSKTPIKYGTDEGGYKFSYWCTNAAGKDAEDATQYIIGTDIKITGNITLYAIYDEVEPKDFVTTSYATLGEAIAKAGTTAIEITLQSDAEEIVKIAAGKIITINLNGHKIDGSTVGTSSAITNSGTLVLKGSGNENEVINGTAQSSGGGIDNYGTLTIEGVTVNGAAPGNGGGICNSAAGVVTIKSGTVSGTAKLGGGIYNKGTLIVEGGTISGSAPTDVEGCLGNAIYSTNAISVSGGTISNSIYLNGSTLTITGGTVSSSIERKASESVTISGGTFANALSDDYLAVGYEAVETDAGDVTTWVVTEKDVHFTGENTLNVSSDLKFRFYFKFKDSEVSNLKAKFTIIDSKGNSLLSKDLETFVSETDGKYFEFDGISPQFIGTDVKAELLVKDGENYVVVHTFTRSILDYLKGIYGSNDGKYDTLITDLVDYGIAANAYAKVKWTDAVGDEITRPDWIGTVSEETPNSSYVYKISGVPDAYANTASSYKFISANVIFDVTNTLYVKYSMPENCELTVKKVQYTTDPDDDSKMIENLVDVEDNINVDTTTKAGICYLRGITAKQYLNTYKFIITDKSDSGNPVVVRTLYYGIGSYTYSMSENGTEKMQDLAIATYRYGLSAQTA